MPGPDPLKPGWPSTSSEHPGSGWGYRQAPPAGSGVLSTAAMAQAESDTLKAAG